MKNIHRRHVTLLAAILLAAGTLTADAKPERQPQFLLESKILSSENIQPFQAAITNTTGMIGGDEALRTLFGTWQDADDLSVLSAPSITCLADQEALIRVQSEVQYFERTKNGTFALRSLPEDESAGVRLKTTASNTRDRGQVSVKVDLQINTLKDRKKLPDVSLDVGSPVMQTRNISTQIVIPVGQWMWIGGQQLQDIASGKPEHLLILLKVTRTGSK